MHVSLFFLVKKVMKLSLVSLNWRLMYVFVVTHHACLLCKASVFAFLAVIPCPFNDAFIIFMVI